MKIKKYAYHFTAVFLASVTLLPIITTTTVNADTNSSNVSAAQNNSTLSDSNTNDQVNALNNSSTYSLAPSAQLVQSAVSYKEGVNKEVSEGMTKGTIYVSKTRAQMIVGGSAIAVGGVSGAVVGTLLNLAGFFSQFAIKGGVWLKYEYVKDWNGLYHTTLMGWGWQ